MNIALLGYGKMGKVIEEIALKRGHKIVAKTSSSNSSINYSDVDIAIDFSLPSVAFSNISQCLNNNVPVISGTTGWLDKYDEIVTICNYNNGAFIYASNFSLGVNLFFELNTKLAKLMSKFEDYKVSIEEIHHTQKLDAPSGTAISLAKQIINNSSTYKSWQLETCDDSTIAIKAKRIENVPGTHNIVYDSEIDSIEIKHTAHNRKGFALGAVIAAEWLIGKTGIFTMKDVLNIS